MCPANPLANDYMFFYEDIDRVLSREVGNVTENDTLFRAVINSKKAYSATMELGRFDWRSASTLNLAPKGSGNSSGSNTAVELLPGPDFANSLLVQTDKIHALVIKAIAENPYSGTNTQINGIDRITMEEWWGLYYQLEWEISKAERDVELLKQDAVVIFDEAEDYLANNDALDKTRYIEAFRSLCATYIDKLDQISLYLEQAREAGWKLRCYVLSSSPIN